jgi:hypothetical protein
MDLIARAVNVLGRLNASPIYANYTVTTALLRMMTAVIFANVPIIQIPVRALSAPMVLSATTGSVFVRRAP